jgi:peroxiredoxin
MAGSIPDINETAPDFSVLTENGAEFNLNQELTTGNHVLLVFYRGHW